MDFPARIITSGNFSREDILLEGRDLQPLLGTHMHEVDRYWEEECRHDPNLGEWPILASTGIVVDRRNNRITLVCGKSSYKLWMGTTRMGSIPAWYEHRSIAAHAITTTSDGYLLLGIRSPLITYPLLRHVVPAGRLRPDEGHPFDMIMNEFQEELGIRADEVTQLECVGVVGDEILGRRGYEFIFTAHISLTADEAIRRAPTGKSISEHAYLMVTQMNEVEVMLRADPTSFPPTGWAGLQLASLQPYMGAQVIQSWTTRPCTYEQFMGHRLGMVRKA